MSAKVSILDGTGEGNEVKVTSRGQLVTAPLEFSDTFNIKAELDNTAYNLVTPLTNKQFVITDIILTANKNVGAADATVELYEANAVDTTTVEKCIIQLEMKKSSTLPLTGLNMITTKGVWINIKTDDDDVFATLMGYYIDA